MRKYYILKFSLFLFVVFSFQFLQAQNFKLVKDINQQTNSNPSNTVNNSTSYAVLNGKAYFAADDGVHGVELWSSDGTEAGTKLAMDINPGGTGSGVNFIYTFKDKIYFFATKDGKYTQFWKCDGTAAGTQIMIDSLGLGGYGAGYAELNNELYFTLTKNRERDELWKTNGTPQSLQKIINIDSLGNGYGAEIGDLTPYSGRVFFTINRGSELWVTNGTHAATEKFRFKDNDAAIFFNLFVSGGKLYFGKNQAFWQSGGDSASTARIAGNIFTNVATLFKNNVYIISQVGNYSGFNLFKLDSSAAYNYTLVSQLETANLLTNARFVQNYKDSLLYFVVNDTTQKPQLWVTDGTGGGTKKLVADSSEFSNLFAWNSKIYFSHSGKNAGEELWVTDGSIAGTKMAADINPGIYGAYPQKITLLGPSLLFTANTAASGNELWKTNGTAGGTFLVKDINTTSTSSSNPISAYPGISDTINNRLIFQADDGIHGNELWSTNGTNEGTYLTKDILAGSASGKENAVGRQMFAKYKNFDYFFARSATNFYALWKTGGNSSNTMFVSDLYHWPTGMVPKAIGATGKYLFAQIGIGGGLAFSSSEVDSVGNKLFAYNGNGEPVLLKKGFFSPDELSFTSNYQNLLQDLGDNICFFASADLSAKNVALWKSDGTPAGTGLVKTLYPGQQYGYISAITQFNGQAFFLMNSGFGNNPDIEQGVTYLWKSDLTTAGTNIVKKIRVFEGPLVVANNKLYFIGQDNFTGQELWITDGTEAGTHLVKDINAGAMGSYIYSMVEFDNKLYFLASVNGTEWDMYKTDGTDAGTVLVKTQAGSLVKGEGKLYYINDNHIWQSDGTAAGTVQMSSTGIEGVTALQNLTYAAGKLYFGGYTNQKGTELYTTTQSLLPVTLLTFTGQLQGNNALLQWTTINEQDNNYFNIQRSLNGRDFSTIGKVNAHGSGKENDYNYVDANVTALGIDKLYYRLQQVDLDGKFTYSKTIALDIPGSKQIQVTPNPAVGFTTVQSTVDMPNAVIRLVDMTGRVLYSVKQNIQAGGRINIPLTGYAKGIYSITIEAPNKKKQEFRLVVE